ncbi:MAG: type III pantothenate kinase [Bacteroidales bacterium]|nr:type III pantothenate kinase [Bacteroidales bacterium]
MNLIIDIGNTRSKYAVFNNSNLVDIIIDNAEINRVVNSVITKHPINNCILSSVKNIPADEIEKLKAKQSLKNVIILSHQTEIPVKNCYQTHNTLGLDRIAAVVGANELYPNQNCLVIDCGSAITYDLITAKSEYLGGNIAPGIEMRFKALNKFTDKLPLLTKTNEPISIGNSTNTAITRGVENGTVFEILGYIDHYSNIYEKLRIIITGGDALFFESKIKKNIFVNQNLVLIGLNRILNANAKN